MSEAKERRREGRAPGRRVSRRGGFSLVEVMFSTSVLVVGLLVALQSIISSMVLTEEDEEIVQATAVARGVMERLRDEDFAQVYVLHNSSGADDPGGAGTAPGSGFAVPGLDPQAGDPDGLPGRIVFPEQAGAVGWELREDLVDPSLGTPRDLNADGAVDALDHSADYRLLPVVVRVEWRGRAGDCRLEFKTLLADF